MADTKITIVGTFEGQEGCTITALASGTLYDKAGSKKGIAPKLVRATVGDDGTFALGPLSATKGDANKYPGGVTYRLQFFFEQPWSAEYELDVADGITQNIADMLPVDGSVRYGVLDLVGDDFIEATPSDDGKRVDLAHKASTLAAGTHGAIVTDEAGHLAAGTVPVATQAQVDTIATAWTNYQTDLASAVGVETTARQAADTALGVAITSGDSTEATARQGGDATNAAAISALAGTVQAATLTAVSILDDTYGDFTRPGEDWDNRTRWYNSTLLTRDDSLPQSPFGHPTLHFVDIGTPDEAGWWAYADEHNWGPGDVLSFAASCKAASGQFRVSAQFYDAAGILAGSQQNGTASTFSGSTIVLKLENLTVPANSASVKVFVVRTAGTAQIDIYAKWGVKASTAGNTPIYALPPDTFREVIAARGSRTALKDRISQTLRDDGTLLLGDDFGPTRAGPWTLPSAVAAPLGTYRELGAPGAVTTTDPNSRYSITGSGRFFGNGVDVVFTSPAMSLATPIKRRPGTIVLASFQSSDWQIGWAKDTDPATLRGGIRASSGLIQLHNGSAFAPTGLTFSATTEYFIMLALMDTGVATYIRTAGTPWKLLFPMAGRDSSSNNRTSPVKWNITHNNSVTFKLLEPALPLDGKWSRALGNTSDSQVRPALGRAGAWGTGEGVLGCDWTLAAGQVARQRIRKSDSTHYIELVADQAAGRVLLIEQNGATTNYIGGVQSKITEAGAPDGGSFNLSFAVDGGAAQVATGLPWNASAAQIVTALEGLSNGGVGNFACNRTGAAGAYAWTITPLASMIGHDFAIVIVANNLTVGGIAGGTLTISNSNYSIPAGSIYRFEVRAEGTDIRAIASPGTLTVVAGTSSLNTTTGGWELPTTATGTPSRLGAYELWGPVAIPRTSGIRPLYIWSIGDSLTVGSSWDDPAVGWTGVGYPWYLMELLEQARGAGAYERPPRTATGGWSILDEAATILAHIATALADATPDAVLFDLGTNDRTFQNRAPGAYEQDFKVAYGYVMDQLNLAIPKARIFCAKPWAPGYYWDRIEQAYALTQSGSPTGGNFTVSVAVESVYSLKLTGSPTGGNFDLGISVDGGAVQTANAIPYNVSAATLQSTLQALSNIGAGNLLAAASGPFTINSATVNNLYDLTTAGALLGHTLTFTITPHFTGGTSPTLTQYVSYNGGTVQVTPSQSWNIGPAALEVALEALPNVGAGNMRVERSGAAGAYTWTVTPRSRLAAHNVAISVSASLSGGVAPALNNTPNFVTRSTDSFDTLAGWIDDVIAERMFCTPGIDKRQLLKVPDGTGHYKYLSTIDNLHYPHIGYMLIAQAWCGVVLPWFPATVAI